MQAASDPKASVFVSYRREGGFLLAKYIFDHLHAAGYDVFMDVHSLGAGEFEQTTLAEVAARDYFLLVITSGSLTRMIREDDWLRKELMQAVKNGRTVVPVLAEGVKFEDHRVREVLEKLPRALQDLPSFNAIRIPQPEYFDSAMKRLISFLKPTAVSAPSHGTPKSSRKAAPPKTSRKAAAPKSVAQAQSDLHKMPLTKLTSLPKIQSATPWSDLQATLLGTGGVRVNAPTLKEAAFLKGMTVRDMYGLSWTEVSKADKYVLEESDGANFMLPSVVYEGSKTIWVAPWIIPPRKSNRLSLLFPYKYYRVKAIGKGTAGESDWSNVVIRHMTAKPSGPPRPPAPTLKEMLFGLTWTEVSEADKYVLEESGDAKFLLGSKVVYQGSGTSWMFLLFRPPKSLKFALTNQFKYYRVKAIGKGAAGESDWSNVVRISSDPL